MILHSTSATYAGSSYFYAETLKYAYLLFSEPNEERGLDLRTWVLNTEAHPLPMFEWNEQERQRYNIVS